MTHGVQTNLHPSSTIDPETVTTIGGAGAVLGAFKAVLDGKSFLGILGAAAIAGAACALVGAIVSLGCHAASDSVGADARDPS